MELIKKNFKETLSRRILCCSEALLKILQLTSESFGPESKKFVINTDKTQYE